MLIKQARHLFPQSLFTVTAAVKDFTALPLELTQLRLSLERLNVTSLG